MDGYTCEKDQARKMLILIQSKKKKSLYVCASVYRVAALMEGAKPKTGSVNTFGERVSGRAASRRPG